MASLDIEKADITNLTGTVVDFSVDSQSLDSAGDQKETKHTYPNASINLGYFKSVSELSNAIRTHAIWVAGKGIETEDEETKLILEEIRGWGEDSFQSIMISMVVQMKVTGDAFCEIIRNEDTGKLLNLKPLYTGDMIVIVDSKGRIIRYEHRGKSEKAVNREFEPEQILHIVNDRFADEIHGTSVIETLKFVIDAKHEAMDDERMIKHRELALGVLYVDTENTTKRDAIMRQYEQAVKKGEVLVLPKDTAELKDTGITPKDRIQWLQYLDNYFYRVVGVPRVLVEADASEAASKVGFLSYDPIFTKDQVLIEQDLWNQMAIRIKFNRPPSLTGVMQESEAKNTGQLGFQPKDTEATMERE